MLHYKTITDQLTQKRNHFTHFLKKTISRYASDVFVSGESAVVET